MSGYSHLTVEETLAHLMSRPSGLTAAEVATRRAEKGPNQLESAPPTPAWKILLGQFTNFIIYLLFAAVLFSLAIGEYNDSLVILAILLLNGLIGFFQELRANRSLDALKKLATVESRVIRDGRTSLIDASELVYGDIIILENGDKIPADARLMHTVELSVEESPLTGESQPVEKCVAPMDEGLHLAEQANMVFCSTAVVGGRGTAVVTSCGMETEIGRITRLVAAAEEERTPLQRRLDQFGRKLGTVIIAICVAVFLLCLARYRLYTESLSSKVFLDFAFIAISLAVAAVPTALPAVVTIALSIGTRRLLAKNMLVRRLTSVETLGSCDVILSDKTGTITRNQMTVATAWTLDGETDFAHADPATCLEGNEGLYRMLTIGMVCNNSLAALETGRGGNPTELALLKAASMPGIDGSHYRRLAERPFDSARKCMSVLVENESDLLLFAKGAPDHLLMRCDRVMQDGELKPLDRDRLAHIEETCHGFGRRALRVMAFGWRKAESTDDTEECGLIFCGLQAMIDPPREGVAEAVRRAREAHIRVVMITGDHRETATAIAATVGITGDIITGSELDEMDDSALAARIPRTGIFARVIPEHKQRIVQLLQEKGHIVAMTGDGVNDAPALKKADIGIAIGSGTDVAREASDFVLLDDSFSSIVAAVEEGRGIYENIQKSIMLLLSGNLMEVLIIFLAVLMGFNLPLTALMLLWINMITDGAPALAYAVDPYGVSIMRRPPIGAGEGILPPKRLRLLLGLGLAGSFLCLALFSLLGGNSEQPSLIQRSQTMTFSTIVLYEMLLVFIIRSSYHVPLFTNGWLWLSVLFSVAMQGVLLYTPLQRFFDVTPLSRGDLLTLGWMTMIFCLLLAMFHWRVHMRSRSHNRHGHP